MRDKRVLATGFIWLMLFLIMEKITAFGNPPYDATVAVILLMLVALASTASVWIFGSEEETPEVEKSKRDSDARVQLLLQLMDEREKAQLKARLLNNLDSNADGELSMDMLLRKY